MPPLLLSRFVTLAKSTLWDLPLLGRCLAGMGHIPVHFKAVATANDFSTDPSSRADLVSRIEERLASGRPHTRCTTRTVHPPLGALLSPCTMCGAGIRPLAEHLPRGTDPPRPPFGRVATAAALPKRFLRVRRATRCRAMGVEILRPTLCSQLGGHMGGHAP